MNEQWDSQPNWPTASCQFLICPMSRPSRVKRKPALIYDPELIESTKKKRHTRPPVNVILLHSASNNDIWQNVGSFLQLNAFFRIKRVLSPRIVMDYSRYKQQIIDAKKKSVYKNKFIERIACHDNDERFYDMLYPISYVSGTHISWLRRCKQLLRLTGNQEMALHIHKSLVFVGVMRHYRDMYWSILSQCIELGHREIFDYFWGLRLAWTSNDNMINFLEPYRFSSYPERSHFASSYLNRTLSAVIH